MKKVLITRLVWLLALLVSLPVCAYGYDFVSGGIYYNIEGDNISVTSGDYRGDIAIPSQVIYNGKAYKVTSIEENAFNNCHRLTSVVIPNTVTTIGHDAFFACSALTSVNIPYGVTYIGDGAFSCCENISSISIPNSVTYIGEYAFWECKIKSVYIPSSVSFIGDYVFYQCYNLGSITVDEGNHTYDSRNNCNAIIETATNTLVAGCKNTIIPQGISSLGPGAFAGCRDLRTLKIPKSLTKVRYGFLGCINLESIVVEEGNTIYDSRNNCNAIIETATNTLVAGCKNTIIPNSIRTIGQRAFSSITSLTSITIPESVTTIRWGAFVGCSGITSMIIPNSVTYIGGFAFDGCKMSSVIIPNSVTFLGECAFQVCSSLTSVTLSKNLKTIEHGVFAYCHNIVTVISKMETPVEIEKSVFPNDVYEKAELIVPKGTKALYQTTEGWNKFAKITEAEGEEVSEFSVNGIYYKVSENNTVSVTSGEVKYSGDVVIPEQVTYSGKTYSVTSIGGSAFEGCSGLTSITIPNSVTSIGSSAFWGCSGLMTIVSEIEKPYIIDECFDSDVYLDAELIVPKGTKRLYQATEGWSQFAKITEVADNDEALFTIDGTTYQGTKSEKTVVVKAVDTSRTWMEIPASVSYDGMTYQVTGIADGVFDGSSMAALIWNVESALTNSAFNNTSIGSNFLLYVKSSSYAPSSVKNVVVDGTAQKIVLSDDGGQFYCPQAFTARSISYTHNYSMETGIGKAKGWETIALPFDVQKISHNTRGEIVPFPAYNSSSNQKPFWLANFSGSSFRRTAAVLANEPYIIAMPNSSSYRNEYNLAGDVTFSADNVQVPKTPSFSGTFMPAFATVAKSSSVYALNVNNRNVKYSGSYDAGSRFISGLRDVRPFEAYMTGSFSRGVIEINFDEGTTSLNEELRMRNEESAGATDGEVVIYTLSGQQMARTSQRDFDAVWQHLPKGVYIVNGKKLIK